LEDHDYGEGLVLAAKSFLLVLEESDNANFWMSRIENQRARANNSKTRSGMGSNRRDITKRPKKKKLKRSRQQKADMEILREEEELLNQSRNLNSCFFGGEGQSSSSSSSSGTRKRQRRQLLNVSFKKGSYT